MAVFRVERNKGYTVMSNHHLRNKELSFPFRSEGLGHFPTSHFQPTRRSAGGRKYGSGYPLPMLATNVFIL